MDDCETTLCILGSLGVGIKKSPAVQLAGLRCI